MDVQPTERDTGFVCGTTDKFSPFAVGRTVSEMSWCDDINEVILTPELARAMAESVVDTGPVVWSLRIPVRM